MSDNTVNIAIVGLGFGAEFIPIYQKHPNANMYAICRRSKKELDEIGDAFGIEHRYTDFDELIQDDNIDAVHINSPIHDHARMSIAALKAGKHVSCTVPMGTTVEECRQIVEAQRESGKKYTMAETTVVAATRKMQTRAAVMTSASTASAWAPSGGGTTSTSSPRCPLATRTASVGTRPAVRQTRT